MAFDWKTDAQGKKYRVAARQRGYFHVYQNGAVKRLGGARPTGFNQFNEKTKQYYKTADDGFTSKHVYANGKSVNMGPGSIWRNGPSGLQGYYGAGNAVSELKYGVPQKTLQTQMGRERGAQNQAYGQIANYYAGMAGNAKGLMDQAGQVGQQTDTALKSIGADRNTQIQAATPQYAGPLGAVAQNMANSEQQAALNRGAAVDQSNRGMNAMTSGNRQAYLGEVGAAQQVAGQERLSTLKGQGSQALNVYADKIAELERQKALGAVDSALQLRTADQTYGLNQQKADQTAANDQVQNQIAQQNADANTTRANKPPKTPAPKSTAKTPAQNTAFWGNVDKAIRAAKSKHLDLNDPKVFDQLVSAYDHTTAAAVRSIILRGGLTPFAASVAQREGFSIDGRYKRV